MSPAQHSKDSINTKRIKQKHAARKELKLFLYLQIDNQTKFSPLKGVRENTNMDRV